MPSLVDSSIFMQAIFCLPLRKGFRNNERMSNHEVITYQELSASVESSTFTQIHQCRSLHWKNNQWKQTNRSDHLHFAKNWHHQLIPLFHWNSLDSLTVKRKYRSSKHDAITYIHCFKRCHAIIVWFLYFHARNFFSFTEKRISK